MDEEKKQDTNNLSVLVCPDADAAGIGDWVTRKEISVDTLKANMNAFTGKLGDLLNNIPKMGDYNLSEVTINVNITAGGELQLVGVARGKGEVSGGITLTFKRP
jgi:hypothetical protein